MTSRNFYSAIVAQAFGQLFFGQEARRFKKLLYVFVMLKCIYWLSYFGLYFGEHSFIVTKGHGTSGLKALAFLLYDSSSSTVSLLCLFLAAALCLVNLYTIKLQVPADLVLWLLVVNLHFKTYPTLTGGENLLNQFLLFNIFLCMGASPSQAAGAQLRRHLHNVSAAGVIVQICLVYLLSALAKLNDPEWRDGSALALISSVEHYRTYYLTGWTLPVAAFRIITWLVIGYQLLFPVLIWFRPLKLPLLVTGIAMHLYIAFGMGLVSFGAVMIMGYVWFWRLPVRGSGFEVRGLRFEV
jgi:hypothetical protein